MSLWKDVQFSLRTMRKSPRITIAVVVTLTLGIPSRSARRKMLVYCTTLSCSRLS
jgi:hypothetical protein